MGLSSSSLIGRAERESTPLPVPPFRRNILAVAPAFEIVVGNLKAVATKIEDNTGLRNAEIENTYVKEKLTFFCIVNPPRHGKSLLLDSIFSREDDFESVLVVETTYNSNTPFEPESETNDVSTVMHYFWLRVLKAVLNWPENLETMHKNSAFSCVDSLEQVREITHRNYQRADPFLKSDDTEKNVLICVDEFSLLTDYVLDNFSKVQQNDLIAQLNNSTSSSVRFVMTGFNTNMSILLANVTRLSLAMCTLSSSLPLLRHIQAAYSAHHFSVPSCLFECVKCTPGLVGLWAEHVKSGRFDTSLARFASKSAPWFQKIIAPESLMNNWTVIESHLRSLEKRPFGYPCTYQELEIGHELVKLELGLCPQLFGTDWTESEPQLIPVCLVLVANAVYTSDLISSTNLMRNYFLEHIVSAFDVSNGKSEGEAFKLFVYHALNARFSLRCAETTLSDDQLGLADAPLCDLFPSHAFKVTASDRTFTLHAIVEKIHLHKFLLPPLYRMLPIGMKALAGDGNGNDSDGGLLSWIQNSEHDGFSFEPETQEIDTPCKLVFSATPPKPVQLVFNKGSWTFGDDDVDVTNRMSEYRTAVAGMTQDQVLSHLKQPRPDHNLEGLIFSTLHALLLAAYRRGPSVIMAANCAEGGDVVVVWTNDPWVEFDEIVQDSARIIVHVAAVELKDRRQTGEAEWETKLNSLSSSRCSVWWLKEIFRETLDVHFHVVFAGPEHT